jgi:hypothetical protein
LSAFRGAIPGANPAASQASGTFNLYGNDHGALMIDGGTIGNGDGE